MKKITLSLGLLLGLVSIANAQTRFGVKAGLSLSTVTGNNTGAYKSLVGGQVGVMADVSFSDLVSFHPELLYSQKGAKIDETDPSGSGATNTGQARLGYIDLPLLLRIKASGLFFEAGPQVGFLLTQNTEQTINIPGYGSTSNSSSSTDGTRKVDLGYVVGLGYQLKQGLEFGLRYNGGFTDLSDPSATDKNYNSVFQFQVGYLFGGK